MAYIPPSSNNANLTFSGAYSPPASSSANLTFSGGTTFGATSNLSVYIKGVVEGIGLPGYIKSTIQASLGISASIKGFQNSSSDLSAFINGKLLAGEKNLFAQLTPIPPVDLSAYVNVIEIRNLQASIVGELRKGQSDLSVKFNKIFDKKYKNLFAFIHGYDTADLVASIRAFQPRDLYATITGVLAVNLPASINPIPPQDLSAYIFGYAVEDLPASLVGVRGPYDLEAYIFSVGPKDLSATINGFGGLGIISNLSAYIQTYNASSLSAYINVLPQFYSDLGAYINATGFYKDLRAAIYPMVVHIKRMVSVALLEHANLGAIINSHCFNSGYRDLSAYVYPIMKSDLSAVIVGWKDGSVDGMSELKAYINAEDYFTEDTIPLTILPSQRYTQLKLILKDTTTQIYNVFDTIHLRYAKYSAGNLSAYIYAMPRGVDLPATITAVQDIPYRSVPAGMHIKTREIFINLTHLEAQWRRVVEVFFDNTSDGDPYYYFYVAGENKVYKVDRSKHWILRAEGFTRTDEENNVDRTMIRRKFIINMSSYSSIDEAMRDIMDRAAFYRRSEMSAYINGVLPVNRGELGAYINVRSRKRWVHHLNANIVGVE